MAPVDGAAVAVLVREQVSEDTMHHTNNAAFLPLEKMTAGND